MRKTTREIEKKENSRVFEYSVVVTMVCFMVCFIFVSILIYSITPPEVCNIEIVEAQWIILDYNQSYFSVDEGFEIKCEEGVEVDEYVGFISFNVFEYCGLSDVSDDDIEFWDNYYECKQMAQKRCVITQEIEVCEIK